MAEKLGCRPYFLPLWCFQINLKPVFFLDSAPPKWGGGGGVPTTPPQKKKPYRAPIRGGCASNRLNICIQCRLASAQAHHLGGGFPPPKFTPNPTNQINTNDQRCLVPIPPARLFAPFFEIARRGKPTGRSHLTPALGEELETLFRDGDLKVRGGAGVRAMEDHGQEQGPT